MFIDQKKKKIDTMSMKGARTQKEEKEKENQKKKEESEEESDIPSKAIPSTEKRRVSFW